LRILDRTGFGQWPCFAFLLYLSSARCAQCKAARRQRLIRPAVVDRRAIAGNPPIRAPPRDQSTLEPRVRFATVPVIAPEQSDARNAAVPTSASVGNRLRRVHPSRSSREALAFHLGEFRSHREGIAYPMRPETNDTDALRAKFPSIRPARRRWLPHGRRFGQQLRLPHRRLRRSRRSFF
jgi:hypothetical protein